MKTIIAPSTLSADLSRLGEEVRAVTKAGADWIHLDVMDGQFVPPITIGPAIVAAIRENTTLPLDVHLMIERPENQIEAFVKAGADLISIHVEAAPHLYRLVQNIHEYGKKAGVALNPVTPVSTLKNIITEIELVLIMTVNPGWGGQKYISAMDQKIKEAAELIRETGKEIYLEIDGGINAETAKHVTSLGANVLVAGSYVFGKKDYKSQIDSLR